MSGLFCCCLKLHSCLLAWIRDGVAVVWITFCCVLRVEYRFAKNHYFDTKEVETGRGLNISLQHTGNDIDITTAVLKFSVTSLLSCDTCNRISKTCLARIIIRSTCRGRGSNSGWDIYSPRRRVQTGCGPIRPSYRRRWVKRAGREAKRLPTPRLHTSWCDTQASLSTGMSFMKRSQMFE